MQRWQIGAVTVTQVVELTTGTVGAHILPQATPEALAAIPWLGPYLDERGRPLLSMHSLILETPSATIMVDTCIGNDKVRAYPKWNQMQGDYLERLDHAGFSPERFDAVLCTHLHVDHVGWNTRLVDGRWVPTFTNARYLFARDEWAHWQHEEQEYGPVVEDSVQPIFDAGLAELVDGTHQVCPEVRLEPTPGHTPGHVSVHITSQGEEAVITGDLMHHPCQMHHLDWSSTADHEPAQATRTRTDFLQRYSDRPVLVIGTHFAGPTAGRVVRDGDRYRLDA